MGETVLDEVRDIIALPNLDAETAEKQEDVVAIENDERVIAQLSNYVSSIAAMYQGNPFHNFEQSCEEVRGQAFKPHRDPFRYQKR
jgi:hypothetical protein